MNRIGRYAVRRRLGSGGMGIVYAAHDDRLDRTVAIKVLRPDVLVDEHARRRFTAEARAAARVSHPHVCPLYEFDEHEGQPFLVMELLEGEPLAARLARGRIPPAEALPLADAMLSALAALHRGGVLHRDLKPSNIFLTPYGLKLLDFGLARPLGEAYETRLTQPGLVMGTPAYMAPEQLLGGTIDERTDVFAAASVIYEMIAGRPAFVGATVAALVHAVAYSDPPPLDGDERCAAIDRVLRQAFAKNPDDRIARADLLATTLREAAAASTAGVHLQPASNPDSATRFVALPLRVLRPDPETDFLAFSVPDAVSVSLAAVHSLVVRPARAPVSPDGDVCAIGREMGVDVVLTGTLLRAGQHVRVSAQLVDAAAATIIWSETAEAPITDLFQLQDALTTHIVSSLALPLTARDRSALDRQAPASAEAYERYLRANTLMNDPSRLIDARDLYLSAVAIDPGYAPAWARLGRAQRVIAKWGGGGTPLLSEAEAAFRRAFEIDPDLPIAHDLAAYVDAELGRAVDAIERLLLRARRRGADPGLMSGLVTTCRYAGLLDASRAAHDRAVAMDATQQTSIAWTHLLLGDYASAARTDRGTPPYAALLARLIQGDLTTELLRQHEATTPALATRLAVSTYRALFERQVDEGLDYLASLRESGFNDPEGWYFYAYCLARAGAPAHALEYLARAIDGGYAPHVPLTREPEWRSLAGDARFVALVDRTTTMVSRARQRFEDAGGRGVLAAPGFAARG